LKGIGSVRAAASTPAVKPGAAGSLALRPGKIAINAPGQPAPAGEKHLRGKGVGFLFHGGGTIYIVEITSGPRLGALGPEFASGRTRFFDVGDTVDVSWKIDAGHFLAG